MVEEGNSADFENGLSQAEAETLQINADTLRAAAKDLENQADILDIGDVLPGVEQAVIDWYQKPQGRAYPSGESIASLQEILDVESDGILGFETVDTFLNTVREGLDVRGFEGVSIDFSAYPGLTEFAQGIAPQSSAALDAAMEESYKALLETEKAARRQQMVDYVREQYTLCHDSSFFFDPELYVNDFLQGIEQGAEPKDALDQACDVWLSPLNEQERGAIKQEVFDVISPYLAAEYLYQEANAIKASVEEGAPAIAAPRGSAMKI